MDRVAAVNLAMTQCAAGTDPAIAVEDVAALVDATLRWTVWAPATQYRHGDLVVPTLRNGHRYEALVDQEYPGLSAASEPIWPRPHRPGDGGGAYRQYRSYRAPEGRVLDGTALWRDAGPDGEQYDARLATYNAWRLKAGRASERILATFGPDKTWANQVYDHCVAMAQIYKTPTLG